MNALRYRVYKVYSLFAYALPLGGLFIVNKDTYIKSANTGLSFFGFVVVMFFAIAFKSKILAAAKKNTILTVSIIVFAVALIMQYLATQLLMISGASLLGCVFSMGFENVADVYFARSYEVVQDGRKVHKQTPPLTHKNAWRVAFGGREV